MADDDEKMVALKKAYADMILNQSKEAATRIMISERKALQFQQELFCLKDESIRMLVRLKQIMDSQATEAENVSLSQRIRIKELEVQLKEAKDSERSLKVELEEAHNELAKVRSNSGQSFNEQIGEGKSTSELPLVDSRLCPISPESSNVVSSRRSRSYNSCPARENSTEMRDSPEKYDRKTGLVSMIMKNKSPELYKNGCTQRIRAFERNGNVSNLAEDHHHFSGTKDEHNTEEHQATEGTSVVATPRGENIASAKKNRIESGDKDKAFGSLRRSSRKSTSIYRKTEVSSCTLEDKQPHEQSSGVSPYPGLKDEVVESRKPSITPRSKNKIVNSREGLSRSIEQDEQRNSESNLIPVSSLNSTKLDGSVSNGVKKNSSIPDCVNPNEVHPSSIASDSKDDKQCELTKIDNDKPLKYTFVRKRKRENFSSPEKCESLEQKNTTKKKSREDKQSSEPEAKKSNLIVGSSRDSRRLAQVARQLISLSEKRW